MASLSPAPFLQFFDPVTGEFLNGGLLYTYAAGTTTPKQTFTDGAGAVPHANPIVLDSAGSATVYLTPGEGYRFVLKRANESTVDTIDPVTALDLGDIEDIVDGILDEIVLPIVNGGTGASTAAGARTNLGIAYPIDLVVACSDETTDIVADAAALTFRAPRAMTLSKIKASLNVASATGDVEVDVLKNGVSVFSVTLTIDATETTSETATVPAALSTTAIAADDIITVSLVQDGSGAKGLKVYLLGVAA